MPRRWSRVNIISVCTKEKNQTENTLFSLFPRSASVRASVISFRNFLWHSVYVIRKVELVETLRYFFGVRVAKCNRPILLEGWVFFFSYVPIPQKSIIIKSHIGVRHVYIDPVLSLFFFSPSVFYFIFLFSEVNVL